MNADFHRFADAMSAADLGSNGAESISPGQASAPPRVLGKMRSCPVGAASRIVGCFAFGRISESCTPVWRRASGFGVPPSGGGSLRGYAKIHRINAELQTRFLKAEPIFATFGDAPSPFRQPLFFHLPSGRTRGNAELQTSPRNGKFRPVCFAHAPVPGGGSRR